MFRTILHVGEGQTGVLRATLVLISLQTTTGNLAVLTLTGEPNPCLPATEVRAGRTALEEAAELVRELTPLQPRLTPGGDGYVDLIAVGIHDQPDTPRRFTTVVAALIPEDVVLKHPHCRWLPLQELVQGGDAELAAVVLEAARAL